MSSDLRPRDLQSQPGLSARLALGFGSLLALLTAVVVLAAWHLRAVQSQAERVARDEVPRMLAVQEIVQHAQGHGEAMARLLTSPRSARESIYPALDAESAAIDRLLATLAPQLDDPQAKTLVLALDEARHRYRAVFAEVGTWIEAGDPAGAAKLFANEGEAALRALTTRARALLRHQQAAMEASQVATAQRIELAEVQLAALAALALVAASALAWRIGRSVARPMRELEAAAHRLAAGDYAARADIRAGREIQRVSRALNDMASAIETRNAEIERIAYQDSLTALPNPARLAQWAAAAGPAHRFAIVLDVARLSTVNDVLGHQAGDRLLSDIAQRLQRALTGPQGDAVAWLARLPGGVFAVVGEGAGRDRAEGLWASLMALVAHPASCEGHLVDVRFSGGLALCEPGDDAAGELRALLRHAEEALSQAKQQRLAWLWYERVDPQARRRQLGLLGSLQAAAACGELEMWLQPKQRLAGPQADAGDGFEALVRWRHPQRGYVSPAEFVPFAERAGMVQLITNSMIDQALATLALWKAAGAHCSIAVNVSTADLLDEGFAQRVIAQADAHGAPLAQLRLEITESRLMQDAGRALAVMQALRAAGVQWSIDDFGTGYSSLSYLQRLPVSELKIDRSFVDRADESADRRALLQTIIQMGHGLHMQVTAEGVERVEELALLKQLGCDRAQGYLIARPMPLAAAASWAGLPQPSSPASSSAALSR
jgi:diguanylate cyclase (GGDEF)-like protein